MQPFFIFRAFFGLWELVGAPTGIFPSDSSFFLGTDNLEAAGAELGVNPCWGSDPFADDRGSVSIDGRLFPA